MLCLVSSATSADIFQPAIECMMDTRRWGDVVLGLPADSVITLQAGERLIVLAED